MHLLREGGALLVDYGMQFWIRREPPALRSRMNFQVMDFVFLDVAPNRAVLGAGPFRREREFPRTAEAAFYLNDFALSSDACWLIPNHVCQVENPLTEPGVRVPSPASEARWSLPSREKFGEVFEDIEKRLEAGRLQKAVLSVVESISVNGSGASFDLSRAQPAGAWRYGYQLGEHGAVGLTPEVLVTVSDGMLRTMALAGTAPATNRASFSKDAKQIREHQFVVDALVKEMGQFGDVQLGDRKVIEFAGLLHFQTGLTVALQNEVDLDAVVRAIHPSPALGVFPRNAANLGILTNYRECLGVPDGFGAPLGVWFENKLHMVAAIRGFFWNQNRGCLPAGCGVIFRKRPGTRVGRIGAQTHLGERAHRLGMKLVVRSVLAGLSRIGVTEYVVCAGARNAALVVPLATASQAGMIRVWNFSEERSAGFFALGRAACATGNPVAVVTTSGTAAAELFPAIIEAYYQGVPLVAVTADRPRSFRGTVCASGDRAGWDFWLLCERLFGCRTG